MATREENIKTINEVLEQITDEQLEAVAGGRARGPSPSSESHRKKKVEEEKVHQLTKEEFAEIYKHSALKKIIDHYAQIFKVNK